MQWAFALFPWCLAAFAIGWTLRAGARSRGAWILHGLAGANVAVFAFLSAAWAFTSPYLGYVGLFLFIAALAASYRRMRRRERNMFSRGEAGRVVFPALLFAGFAALNVLAFAARVPPEGGIELRFPLKSGAYYVLQGGDGFVANPFHVASGTPLALDLVKLNVLGNRATGIAPRALEAYAIFGDEVRSPCAGLVDRIRDGLADNPPARPDVANASGNHVVLRCADAAITLAHLLRGSIAVAAGQAVEPGQVLGKVGNSGNSMEPHLHIDAKANGVDKALLFDGRFLSAGDIFRD